MNNQTFHPEWHIHDSHPRRNIDQIKTASEENNRHITLFPIEDENVLKMLRSDCMYTWNLDVTLFKITTIGFYIITLCRFNWVSPEGSNGIFHMFQCQNLEIVKTVLEFMASESTALVKVSPHYFCVRGVNIILLLTHHMYVAFVDLSVKKPRRPIRSKQRGFDREL